MKWRKQNMTDKEAMQKLLDGETIAMWREDSGDSYIMLDKKGNIITRDFDYLTEDIVFDEYKKPKLTDEERICLKSLCAAFDEVTEIIIMDDRLDNNMKLCIDGYLRESDGDDKDTIIVPLPELGLKFKGVEVGHGYTPGEFDL
jgi:hypothetical protein